MNDSSDSLIGEEMPSHRLALTLTRRWWLVVGALSAMMALKLFWIVRLGSPTLELDALEYFQLGKSVADGDVWLEGHPIAYRTPAYPWLIGLCCRWTESSIMAMVIAQAMLRWLTNVAAGVLAMQLAAPSRWAIWAVPMAMAMSLPTISSPIYVNVLLTETCFTVALTLHLVATLRYIRRPTVGAAMLVAISLGWTILVRPIAMLLWLPHCMHCFATWFRNRTRPVQPTLSRWLMLGCLITLVTSSMLAPWWMRNERLFGERFLTKFVGRNLWIVTFQPESGAGLPIVPTTHSNALLKPMQLTPKAANQMPMDDALQSWRHTWTTHRALIAAGFTDPQSDDQMKQVAMESATASPRPFLWKAIRRIVNFWRTAATDLPVAELEDDAVLTSRWLHRMIDARSSQSVALNTSVILIALASLVRLAWIPASRDAAIWVGLILVYFQAITGILEIPDYRYRMVLEPLLTSILAAGVIGCIPWTLLKTETRSESVRQVGTND
ncbi:MAG: hypothetical protein AAF670_02950 [Planctomycetota bacterium]